MVVGFCVWLVSCGFVMILVCVVLVWIFYDLVLCGLNVGLELNSCLYYGFVVV